MGKSRYISLVVVGLYLVWVIMLLLQDQFKTTSDAAYIICLLAIWVLISLALIWFADDIAPFLGSGRLRDFLVPDWTIFVSFVSWVMLVLPLTIMVVRKIR